MKNQKLTKKRNPADLTRRNNNARKKEIADLKARIIYCEKWMANHLEVLYANITRLNAKSKRSKRK